MLVVHGSFLLENIRLNILNNDEFRAYFIKLLRNSCDETIQDIVMEYLLGIYTRMRGEDFCYKLLKKESKLKTTVRTTQIVLANPDNRPKKRLNLNILVIPLTK